MYTISFSATVGANAGYGHSNENQDAAATVAAAWQVAAAEHFSVSGVYVGGVVSPALTVYHTDWGCPAGGEATATVSGVCNPNFTAVADYRTAVVAVLKAVAESLGQSTTQVVFTEADLEYMKLK